MINERENKTKARGRESKKQKEREREREKIKGREKDGKGERVEVRESEQRTERGNYLSLLLIMSHTIPLSFLTRSLPLFISQSFLNSLSPILYFSISLFPTHSFTNSCSLLPVFIALNHILIPPPCYNKLRIKNI